MKLIDEKIPKEIHDQLPAYYFKLKLLEVKKGTIPLITLKKNNTKEYKVNKFHKLI